MKDFEFSQTFNETVDRLYEEMLEQKKKEYVTCPSCSRRQEVYNVWSIKYKKEKAMCRYCGYPIDGEY